MPVDVPVDLRVGIRPPHAHFEGDTTRCASSCAPAEAAGLDHLCVGDHVSFRDGRGYDGLVHATALCMLSALPVHTSVYLLTLRHPVAVARQVASLAQLAPGRFVFGVGLGGDDPHELQVCGVDPRTRGRRMDEGLAIVRRLLAGRHGRRRRRDLRRPRRAVLPPPSEPVPIVVGGRSDAAVQRAARLGDGWLGVFVTPDRWASTRDRVEHAAATLGRRDQMSHHGLVAWCGFGAHAADATGPLAAAMESLYHQPYDRFARYAPVGTPDDVAAALAPYVDAGCTTVNLIPVAADDADAIEGCARSAKLLQGAVSR